MALDGEGSSGFDLGTHGDNVVQLPLLATLLREDRESKAQLGRRPRWPNQYHAMRGGLDLVMG